MADQNQEPIPLGGSTSDGAPVAPAPSQTAVITPPVTLSSEPAQPKKKGNVIVVFILFLFALLMMAAVGLGVAFLFATSDTMPKAPEITGNMQTVVKDSAVEMIKDKKIRLNSNEINIFLEKIVNSAEPKLTEKGIQINDLFAVVSNDKITLYCRANYKGVTWPIKATADVSYDNPYIVVNLSSAWIGKIQLPHGFIIDRIDDIMNVENVSFHNGMIYFDTTDFNDQISDLALSELGLSNEDVGETPAQTDENQGFSIKRWFGNLVNGVKNKVRNWAAQKVSSVIHDVKFEEVKVIDDELVVTITFDQKAEQDDETVSSTDTADAAA